MSLPALPEIPVTFTSSATGTNHSLALGSSGHTYAWGFNGAGQLGIDSTSNALIPSLVKAPDGVRFVSVAAGDSHSLALGTDDNAYAWGYNGVGQLGIDSTTDALVPTLVPAPDGVKFGSMAAGAFHSLAIGSDGNTYAWGYNIYGQLGVGSTTDAHVPNVVRAPAGVEFTSVAAGLNHSLAIGSDGNTYAWGNNVQGQLGNSTTSNSNVPTVVSMPAGVSFTSVAAGQYHSLAIGSDGNTYAWGRNSDGQLGNSSTRNSSVPVLVRVPAGVSFTSVVGGDNHSLAVASDGSAYGWGNNGYGQLGNDSMRNAFVPTMVKAPSDVTFEAVAAGRFRSVAAGADGNALAWGHNEAGQLGNGSIEHKLVPTPVTMPKAETELARVLFGGIPAPEAEVRKDGTIRAVTPESGVCGPVDVTVEWIANGRDQDPVVYQDGFTFTGEYKLSAPEDQTVKVGTNAVFTTGWTACDGGEIVWEISLDGGKTWQDASTHSGVTVSDKGLTATVTATAEYHGALVRATGKTNEDADVVSDAAELTLAPVTVSFEPNGGSAVDGATVPFGEAVAAPVDPVRDGFTFAGWFVDAAGTVRYDFAAPVVEDVMLYAGWTEIVVEPHTVTFDSAGGSAVDPVTVPDGEAVAAPVDPVRDGFTFAGWFVDAAGTVRYDFAAPVVEDVMLYAGWTEIVVEPHTVTFDSAGGSAVDPVTVPDGEAVAAPVDPVRDGFTFAGWFVDAAGTVRYDFAAPVVEDVTLYAGWTEIATGMPPTVPPASSPGTKPGGGSGLPDTGGSDAWGATALGLAALGAGAFVLALRRRRLGARD
ncbi:InlB B-repeat-containing protein [Leucobacter aridicollis]|uniref:Putative repeat protein (TIGR02543 family)/LPXTG-motif cell wall-anchored protein n=3 Tax=Leucobacter aridicollis TaxID=283878 RepID=A0A852RNR8_9MICO|nr:putative repeat protein (TIGR02543 family)/LPXTG-motif cell wall-anchored protein [Leucobacter aridicollis]